MITYYYKTLRDKNLRELPEFRTGAWIYVEDPTDEELELLSQTHTIDPGLLSDAIDPYEVPRLEIDNKVVYVYTRFPARYSDDIATVPFLLAVGPDFVLTVCRRLLPFIERITKSSAISATTQKIKLFLQLFSATLRAYQRSLTNIGREVHKKKVYPEQVKAKDIFEFVRFESTLNDFLSALVPSHNILHSLLSGKIFPLFEEDLDITEDLKLSSEQLINTCKTNLKTIVNLREAYSAVATSNLNSVIKLLTSLTVVLTIPTIITSFYGMNVPLPFAGSPYAPIFIIVLTLGISAALIYYFSRKHWL